QASALPGPSRPRPYQAQVYQPPPGLGPTRPRSTRPRSTTLQRTGTSTAPAPAPAPARRSTAADSSVAGPPHLPPRPLFSPTALIVGDSIVRNVRFFTTRCFPGATVASLLDKLPGCCGPSHPPYAAWSSTWARRQSERTKKDFMDLFALLESCGKSVFISGPYRLQTPQLEHLVSITPAQLTTWFLLTIVTSSGPDGLHPSRLGSSVLTGNIHYSLQSAPRE
uniref:Uncharacterized protein n=1 Tax=Stegastes partitus TaxID=144197 RepID=A0A3B5ATE7_9TELE